MSTPVIWAFDTETTGLSAAAGCEIVSLAWITLDAELNELSRAQYFAHPSAAARIEPKALEINGYSREAWDAKGATDQETLFQRIAQDWRAHEVARAFPLGHNVAFDLGFLKPRADMDPWFGKHFRSALGYHSLCTITAALQIDIAAKCFPQKYNLVVLCARYGIPLTDAHDSLGDIVATVELFRRLNSLMAGNLALPPRTPTPAQVAEAARKTAAATLREKLQKERDACQLESGAPSAPSADESSSNS